MANKRSKQQNQEEINLHRRKLREREELADIEAAYTPDESDDNSQRELQDEWEYLRAVAISQFPEGKDIMGITANQRLVAIAHCLGWTKAKIEKASGKSKSTITRWLKMPTVELFMEKYQLRAGMSGDVMEELNKLEYAAIESISRIFKIDSEEVAAHRLKLDTFKALFDRTRGKPDQKHEVNSNTILEFNDALKKVVNDPNFTVSEDDEDEIFGELN